MKSIVFPFYKERHKFLVQKWWFRVVLLIYVVWLVISPFYMGFSYLITQTHWCYDGAELNLSFHNDLEVWRAEFEECQILAREQYAPSIGVAVIGSVVLHYLIQLLFFKVLMDFIVLGTRFKRQGD